MFENQFQCKKCNKIFQSANPYKARYEDSTSWLLLFFCFPLMLIHNCTKHPDTVCKDCYIKKCKSDIKGDIFVIILGLLPSILDVMFLIANRSFLDDIILDIILYGALAFFLFIALIGVLSMCKNKKKMKKAMKDISEN